MNISFSSYNYLKFVVLNCLLQFKFLRLNPTGNMIFGND